MSVLTVPIVPTGINTMSELARDPRPVSSLSDTFFLLANQSKDPDLREAIKVDTIKNECKFPFKRVGVKTSVILLSS